MSFASETKRELCRISPKPCCKKAECYGLFLFGRSFTASSVQLKTENRAVAERAARFALEISGASMKISGSHGKNGAAALTVSAESRSDSEKILGALGHTGTEISLRINLGNLENECCPAAFLRGAFLACGTAADPGREYHLEFSVPHRNLANDLIALIRDNLSLGIEPRVSRRGAEYVVYVKGTRHVADFLAYLGAQDAAMRILQVRMFKDLRNRVNRQTNFETANLGKTASAAAMEVLAIRKIQRTRGLSLLPEDLRKLAVLRLRHPELSLRELGACLTPPLSRSGVHHRMGRILKFAEHMENRRS